MYNKVMEHKNYRGIKEVLMVTVLEGKGTGESPYREVHTFIDKDTFCEIACVDTIGKNEAARNIQNAINGGQT